MQADLESGLLTEHKDRRALVCNSTLSTSSDGDEVELSEVPYNYVYIPRSQALGEPDHATSCKIPNMVINHNLHMLFTFQNHYLMVLHFTTRQMMLSTTNKVRGLPPCGQAMHEQPILFRPTYTHPHSILYLLRQHRWRELDQVMACIIMASYYQSSLVLAGSWWLCPQLPPSKLHSACSAGRRASNIPGWAASPLLAWSNPQKVRLGVYCG